MGPVPKQHGATDEAVGGAATVDREIAEGDGAAADSAPTVEIAAKPRDGGTAQDS